MKKIALMFISTAFSLLIMNCKAQENGKQTFYKIIEEDKSSIDALSLYPEETRNAILEASLYPEIILKLENIQSQTREKFITLIENLPEEEQLKIYDITRYENLVKSLGDGGRKSESEIVDILKNYPKEIHDEALEMGRKNHRIIKNINELYNTAHESYQNVLRNYPTQTQQAYNHLIQFPEVIEIMSNNMKMTVAVGDLYKREPDWVKTKLDSLNIEAARKNAEETAEWQKKLEENPELLEEYTNAAEEYAEDNGFDQNEYRQERTQVNEVIYHHYYSYPFWFGYPHWFPYSYWYRWPIWYDWGFFYGHGGAIVLTGLPSYYFTYWFFEKPSNHYYRPRVSSTFITHFKNNPRSSTGISDGVATWLKDNREVIPANLLADDGNHVERMREFGLFESEYVENAARRPGLSREEFLANNPKRYPNLDPPGLRVPNNIARELPELEARRPSPIERGVQRTEPREKMDDIYRPREPERRPRTEPEREIFPERVPQRERPMEPRPKIDRSPTPRVAPSPSPRQSPEMNPSPQPTPRPAPTPRSAPTPRADPSPRPSPAPGSGAQIRTPARNISISSELPSNMQSIDRAIEFHFKNWKRK
ncbi:MAG: DUF3300 domain-containing protein [Bacteroidetes bacterium]|nr:DUF3300 domain-containing protein [Bacteroidota bacterium]HET6244083.1 DUF3300 domain-containing protein [Bacteroidia bacterium]